MKTTALLTLAVSSLLLLESGCMTPSIARTYTPDPSQANVWVPRRQFKKCLIESCAPSGYNFTELNDGPNLRKLTIQDDAITAVGLKGATTVIHYAQIDLTKLLVKEQTLLGSHVFTIDIEEKASGAPSGTQKLLLMWATRNDGSSIEPDEVFRSISRFADYLVLLHNSQPKLPFFAWLEQEIPKWTPGPQGKVVRPALPEDARRLVILAEQAAKDKQYTKAGDLYVEAIRLAPFWPTCYYNAALVFAELNLHEQAIAFMSCYLQLNPDDPNARAIKDRIYLWSDKAAVPDASWPG